MNQEFLKFYSVHLSGDEFPLFPGIFCFFDFPKNNGMLYLLSTYEVPNLNIQFLEVKICQIAISLL